MGVFHKLIDMTDLKFGRLTVKERASNIGNLAAWNLRSNVWIEGFGTRMTATQWSKHFLISSSLFYFHIKIGKTLEEIAEIFRGRNGNATVSAGK